MASEFVPIDVTDSPELSRLAERVRSSGRSHVLKRGDEEMVVVSPTPQRRPAQSRRRRSAAALRHATLESTAGSLEPATRTEDFEAMIRDAKEEHAERTMAKLRQP
jgi:hypothetical protein